MPADPVPLIAYIAGARRSGTTILGRILGSFPDACFVGELTRVWSDGFAENRTCGCGAGFLECPFWRAVVGRASRGFAGFDPAEAARLVHALVRTRHMFRNRFLMTPARRDMAARFAEYMCRLYAGIGRVSGKRIVVDSSKEAPQVLLFRGTPGLDIRVIHMTRDSRAVAWSWKRKKLQPQLGLLESGVDWTRVWLTWEVARRRAPHYCRLKYEDFAADPSGTVSALAHYLGSAGRVAPAPLAALEIQHTVNGNPNRFETGNVPIRPDDEWREKLGAGAALATNLLTWPGMLACGYYRP